MLIFKTQVQSALYNLSDDQIEYQVRDRLSFMRFLGLGLQDRGPDAKTVWLYREAQAQAGKVEELFNQFDGYLSRRGDIARGGQILDAYIVAVPRKHNTREENAAINNGEVPEDWANKPAKRSQKDVEAHWTEKHGKSHYGYTNHVNADRKHKLIRRYNVSDAERAEVEKPQAADRAGQGEQPDQILGARAGRAHIRRAGQRHWRHAGHKIGLVRAKAKDWDEKLADRMRRLGQLRRLNPCPA